MRACSLQLTHGLGIRSAEGCFDIRTAALVPALDDVFGVFALLGIVLEVEGFASQVLVFGVFPLLGNVLEAEGFASQVLMQEEPQVCPRVRGM